MLKTREEQLLSMGLVQFDSNRAIQSEPNDNDSTPSRKHQNQNAKKIRNSSKN